MYIKSVNDEQHYESSGMGILYPKPNQSVKIFSTQIAKQITSLRIICT